MLDGTGRTTYAEQFGVNVIDQEMGVTLLPYILVATNVDVLVIMDIKMLFWYILQP